MRLSNRQLTDLSDDANSKPSSSDCARCFELLPEMAQTKLRTKPDLTKRRSNSP